MTAGVTVRAAVAVRDFEGYKRDGIVSATGVGAKTTIRAGQTFNIRTQPGFVNEMVATGQVRFDDGRPVATAKAATVAPQLQKRTAVKPNASAPVPVSASEPQSDDYGGDLFALGARLGLQGFDLARKPAEAAASHGEADDILALAASIGLLGFKKDRGDG